MKNLVRTLMVFLTGLLLGLVPHLHTLETARRGYEAVGGEFLLPLLPVLVLVFMKGAAKDENTRRRH